MSLDVPHCSIGMKFWDWRKFFSRNFSFAAKINVLFRIPLKFALAKKIIAAKRSEIESSVGNLSDPQNIHEKMVEALTNEILFENLPNLPHSYTIRFFTIRINIV